MCDRSDLHNETIDVFNVEAVEAAKAEERQYVEDLLRQVDFSRLVLCYCYTELYRGGVIFSTFC